MEKLIKNTTIKTYCMRHCCQDTPKRAVHAEEEAVSINTKVKEESNDCGGRGYDDFVPGDVPKTAPSGDSTT